MFKILNGTVVFTGFNEVENVYVRRIGADDYGNFPESYAVGPEVNISANFDNLKECNLEYDKTVYHYSDETADSAKEALEMKNASVYDDTHLMMSFGEFSFPDSRGAGTLYIFRKHILIGAYYDEDMNETGEINEDAEGCVTPIEMFCYGIRRHGEDEITLISVIQHARIFRSNALSVFALNVVFAESYIASHGYSYVIFDENGRAAETEADVGTTHNHSSADIKDIIKYCEFKPLMKFQNMESVCLMNGCYPIDFSTFTADKFLNAVATGPDCDQLTATELKNYYAMFDDEGTAKIVYHHEDGNPWF